MLQSPVLREHTGEVTRKVVRSVLETLSVLRELAPALTANQDILLTLKILSVVSTESL